jgi:hypothetical protein
MQMLLQLVVVKPVPLCAAGSLLSILALSACLALFLHAGCLEFGTTRLVHSYYRTNTQMTCPLRCAEYGLVSDDDSMDTEGAPEEGTLVEALCLALKALRVLEDSPGPGVNSAHAGWEQATAQRLRSDDGQVPTEQVCPELFNTDHCVYKRGMCKPPRWMRR